MSDSLAGLSAERPALGERQLHRLKLGLLAVAALILVGYPLADLLRSALSGPGGGIGAWRAIAARPVVTALTHTVVVSALATMLAGALGVTMALLVARSDLPLRRWFGGAWVAPLIVPAYVTGVAWLDAHSRAGLSDDLAHVAVNWLSGPGGVVLLLALQGAPLIYLLVFAALRSARIGAFEEAARSAGRSPIGILLDITLPLAKSAIAGGMLLVFVSSAADFGIPAVLAIPAGFTTVTTVIYSDLSFAGGANAISSAGALSALLGVVAIALLIATSRANRGRAGAGPTSGHGATSRPLLALGRFRLVAAAGCAAFVVVTTAIPLGALFITSVSPGFRLVFAPVRWVGSSYASALSGQNLAALGRSALLAGSAAVIVALGGAFVALLLRRESRLASAAALLLSLPFALPGSVVAIAVLIAWQRWLYGSLLIILLAYVARFAVIGVRTSTATLGALSEDLVEAARVSGASQWRATRDVVMPALWPGIVTSFAITFLFAVHELTMSSLLYGPATKTFAVAVLDAEQAGEVALTAALAIVVTAITVIVAGAALAVRSSRRLVVADVGIEMPAWQP